MIKKTLLLALMTIPMLSMAQTKTKHKTKGEKKEEAKVVPPPRVWIPNISSYETTHELLVANPMLITDSPGCRVSGFTVSLQAPGHDFYGPLYSNSNQGLMTDVQKGVIKTWGAYKNVTLYLQDIHLNCHETDATSPPLKYYFNTEH